jgi:hypothetical protein
MLVFVIEKEDIFSWFFTVLAFSVLTHGFSSLAIDMFYCTALNAMYILAICELCVRC